MPDSINSCGRVVPQNHSILFLVTTWHYRKTRPTAKAKRTAFVFSLAVTRDLLQQKPFEDGISLDRSGQRHRWGHPLLAVWHRRRSPGHSFSVEHDGREYHRVLRHWRGCGRRRRRGTGSSELASVRSPVFDDGNLRRFYHVFLLLLLEIESLAGRTVAFRRSVLRA